MILLVILDNGKDERFDAILTDLNMPRMDGIELAKSFYQVLPIVMMTNNLSMVLYDSIFDSCDTYIEKTVFKKNILDALERGISKGRKRLKI